MSEDLIAAAREEVEAFNDGDWDRLAAGLTPDCVHEEVSTGRRVQGPDEFVELNKGWKAAFQDARGTITDSFACGDRVAMEITWEGTHSGPLEMQGGEIPASNKRVTIKACELFRIADGKIAESTHYFDTLSLLEQVGKVSADELARAG